MFTSKTQLADMQWIRSAFYDRLNDPTKLPISYELDGKKYVGIPAEFHPTRQRRLIDANIVERTYTGVVPGTGLTLRVECFEYKDYPMFEWTAFFTNNGEGNSPVISNFNGCDAVLPVDGEVTLYHNNGDFCSAEGLETTARVMPLGDTFGQFPVGGRSCDHAWPYYRVLTGNYGYNLVIGWPGHWLSHFETTEEGLLFRAGLKYCNFYLKPGETARSPRISAMGFEGGYDRGVNLWRRYYYAHMLPRTEGHSLEPYTCCGYNGGGDEFTKATTENQVAAIKEYIKRGVKPGIWWIDAGWYPCTDPDGVARWVRLGKWWPEEDRFPDKMKAIGETCKENDVEFLLWFEPERVTTHYWPEDLPKEYLLQLKTPTGNLGLDWQSVFNFGNPEAREWMTNRVKTILLDAGVKIYRQDFNYVPFPEDWWLQNDEENRHGITENLHIQGYLQFWDDLAFDIPDLWIDSCASGGRRNDSEAMRRAVPLHPTDYGYGHHPVKQCFQNTWYEWTPYFRSISHNWDNDEGNYDPEKRSVTRPYDAYAAHCGFSAAHTIGNTPYADEEHFAISRYYAELQEKLAPYLIDTNYFLLTPVRKSNEDYFSIQFHREEEDEGLIQVIRNTRCEEESVTVFPRTLSADKNYRFFAPETNESFTKSGAEIIEKGLTFSIPKRSGIFWQYFAE